MSEAKTVKKLSKKEKKMAKAIKSSQSISSSEEKKTTLPDPNGEIMKYIAEFAKKTDKAGLVKLGKNLNKTQFKNNHSHDDVSFVSDWTKDSSHTLFNKFCLVMSFDWSNQGATNLVFDANIDSLFRFVTTYFYNLYQGPSMTINLGNTTRHDDHIILTEEKEELVTITFQEVEGEGISYGGRLDRFVVSLVPQNTHGVELVQQFVSYLEKNGISYQYYDKFVKRY